MLTCEPITAFSDSLLIELSLVFQELLKLVINCVTSSDIAEDLHLAGSVTGKLAVELLHVRFLSVLH